MKLKEIHRTSTFAWSPLSTPLLATGTVAGALDESFSNDSQLEIWAPDFLNKQEYDLGGEGQNGPRGSVTNTARCVPSPFRAICGDNVPLDRFNRIAWGQADGSRPEGVIAAGMENGELAILDPSKIVAHARCVFVYPRLYVISDTTTLALPTLSYSRTTHILDPFAVWILIPYNLLYSRRVV